MVKRVEDGNKYQVLGKADLPVAEMTGVHMACARGRFPRGVEVVLAMIDGKVYGLSAYRACDVRGKPAWFSAFSRLTGIKVGALREARKQWLLDLAANREAKRLDGVRREAAALGFKLVKQKRGL
jgi:hypothetical protein